MLSASFAGLDLKKNSTTIMSSLTIPILLSWLCSFGFKKKNLFNDKLVPSSGLVVVDVIRAPNKSRSGLVVPLSGVLRSPIAELLSEVSDDVRLNYERLLYL